MPTHCPEGPINSLARPIPGELADIEAHRSLWESMKPPEYTMVIHPGRRTSESKMFTDCATTDPLRVVVVERRPVEVTGLSSGCSLPADESVPTVEGLFDLAAAAATPCEHSIVLDDRWGYVNSIDRVQGEFRRLRRRVRWLVPAATPAHVDAQVEPALDQARRAWDAESPIRLLVRPPHTGLQPVGRHVQHHRRRRATRGIERTDGLAFDESLAAELPASIYDVVE